MPLDPESDAEESSDAKSATIICPRCSEEIPSDSNFCGMCGYDLKKDPS